MKSMTIIKLTILTLFFLSVNTSLEVISSNQNIKPDPRTDVTQSSPINLSPVSRELHGREEESEESSSSRENTSEENPAVNFGDNSEMEHMRNFQAISENLKAYEEEFIDCISEIPDEEFSEEKLDQCIGRNFIKVIIDIKYITMKTMSQGDSKVRSLFVDHCYKIALYDEEFMTGCDVMERDVLNMMWTGLSFVEILEINFDKYVYEYGKVPDAIFKDILQKLREFSNEFFELIDEIDSHKEVTILRIRNYIDDRIKLIAEANEEETGHEFVPAETHHQIEITETTELSAEKRRKLLPELQIGNGERQNNGGDRFVNSLAVNKNKGQYFVNKPQIENSSLFNRMAEQKFSQKGLGDTRLRMALEKGRASFRDMNMGHFKVE